MVSLTDTSYGESSKFFMWLAIALGIIVVVLVPLTISLARSLRERHHQLQQIFARQRTLEERYLDLTQRLADIVMSITELGVIQKCDPASERILGIPLSELKGRNLLEWVPEQQRERLLQDLKTRAQNQKINTPFDANLDTRSSSTGKGGIISLEIIAAPAGTADGVTILECLVRDVTEKRHQEATLQASDSRYRLLVENSHDLVAEIRPDGTLLYHSPNLVEILGYSPEAVQSANILEFVHPEDRMLTRMAIDRHLKTATVRCANASGEYIWLEVSGGRYQVGIDDERVGLVARNITARRLTENNLRESERRYRRLVEQSHVIPWEADGQTSRFTYVGPQSERLTGYSQEKWLEPDFLKHFVEASDLPTVLTALHDKTQPDGEFTFECRARQANGDLIWIRGVGNQNTTDEGSESLRGILFDITDRKRAELLLAAQKRVLELVATSSPLPQVLAEIASLLEGQFKNVSTLFMRFDADANRLSFLSGPKIQQSLQTLLEAVPINPSAGACANAVLSRKPVFLRRGQSSETWGLCDELTRELNLEAVWSLPILGRNGAILGTLASLVQEPRDPTPEQFETLNIAVNLASVALERSNTDAALVSSARRLREDAQTLARLARSEHIRRGDLAAALREIAEAASRNCGVSRSGIWLLEKQHASLRCVESFQVGSGPTPKPSSLLAADHPTFFLALASERVIVADDALNDPRTSEFTHTYLNAHKIRSMLTSAIRVRGEVVGLVSLEETNQIHRWTQEEQLLVGSLADIVSLALQADEQRRAEDALRLSEERYRSVVDTLAEGVMLTEADGRVAAYNGSAIRILGLTEQDMKNRPINDPTFTAIREDGSAFPLHEFPSVISLRKGEPTNDVVMGILRPDGSLVWISTSTRLLSLDREGHQRRVVISFVDITERRRTAEALKRAHEELEIRVRARTAELESANRELSDFAYIVTHDLKAPLRAVGNLAEWIARDYQERLGEDGVTLFLLLRERVSQMHHLIDGILSYTRIGRTHEKDGRIDLKELLSKIVLLLAPPPNFTILMPSNLPIINGVRSQVHQLFQNLIDNAIKHHDRQDGRIDITAEQQEGAWLLRVADDGPGIEKKFHQKIFQIFQRLDTKETAKGAGIGLALVKRIVDARGGRVWVESEPGHGTAFCIIWPDTPPPAPSLE